MQIPKNSSVKLLSYCLSGNRTRKTGGKGIITETRYYLGDYELYKRTGSLNGNYERQTTTLSDGEKVFARIEQLDSKPPVVRYQFDNHLGSASLELDSASAIISYEEYHPFGSTSYRSGKTETEVSLKRYKYCGKEKDDETGLYYYGARYYAAWLGRFVSVDPHAASYLSWNPYNYVGNNPINLIDPDGKDWVNAFDEVVKQKEQALLDNPDSNKLKRKLNKAKKNQAKVNVIIKNLKENDVALYNYIENLTVTDAITGEKINVKVTVGSDYRSGRHGAEEASTSYKTQLSTGEKRFVEYEGLEGKYKTTQGPINSNDEIGFDITLFSTPDWADNSLSNEAGDIMFRMEYPDAAAKSGTDKGKTYDNYVKKGTAGFYSNKIEETYKNRKKNGEGKDTNNNPYPIENE